MLSCTMLDIYVKVNTFVHIMVLLLIASINAFYSLSEKVFF